MEEITNLTQLVKKVGALEERMDTRDKVIDERTEARDKIVDARFETLDAILKSQPTKSDINGLASKEDILVLNRYIETFAHGVKTLERGGRVTIYSIVILGGIAAGILVIKTILITILAWFGFIRH